MRRLLNIKAPLAASAVLVVLCGGAQAADSVYMPIQGTHCRDGGSKEEFNIWRCQGPAGYAATFADEGNIVGFGIHRSDRIHDVLMFQWRGADKVFGDRLEWRLVNGKPVAAVLRIWRVDSDKNGREVTSQQLLVLRITPDGACKIGTVDARRFDANTAARSLADGSSPCLPNEH